MKKNDWLLVGITSVFSFLFYKEILGLNLAIFTWIAMIIVPVINKTVLRNKNWITTALGCLISSILVVYYGNGLSILANFVSLFLLIGSSMHRKTSVIFSMMYGIGSVLSSPVFFALRLMEQKEESESKNQTNRKLLLAIIPILITIIFFFIYRSSNSVFASFANEINFDWISWDWVTFMFLSLVFLYGYLNPKSILGLVKRDEVDSLDIQSEEHKELTFFGKTIQLMDEYFSAKVMFISINILIGIVNLLDFNFIFLDPSLPDNMTYSQFLHQGVGMLVLSIAISIVIILFYFRGQLNFYKESKTFKFLAYAWMIQNMFLLVSVCMKNNLYIEQYGLTYKRIGIYIYSILTLIGLFTVLLKIYKVKINMFLVRVNGWSFYTVLLICSMINWDNVIVDHTQKNKNGYDMLYLMSLNDTTIPSLIELEKTLELESDKKEFHKHLIGKINHFKKTHKNRTWKSWNYQDHQVNFDMSSYQRTLSLTR